MGTEEKTVTEEVRELRGNLAHARLVEPVDPGDYCMTPWKNKGNVSHATAFPWPVAGGAVTGQPIAFVVEGALVAERDGTDVVRWVGQLFRGERANGETKAGEILADVTATGLNGRASVKAQLVTAARDYIANRTATRVK